MAQRVPEFTATVSQPVPGTLVGTFRYVGTPLPKVERSPQQEVADGTLDVASVEAHDTKLLAETVAQLVKVPT